MPKKPHPARTDNHIGKRFNSFTVIEQYRRGYCKLDTQEVVDGHTWVIVRCDCGHLTDSPISRITKGRVKCCLKCAYKIGHPHRRVKPYEHKERCIRLIWQRYKNSANYRDLSFELTLNQVNELVSSPCFYCGLVESRKVTARCAYFWCNGIDRFDNTQGYVLNNCVPCCNVCNRAKCDMHAEAFIEWLLAIKQQPDQRFLDIIDSLQ